MSIATPPVNPFLGNPPTPRGQDMPPRLQAIPPALAALPNFVVFRVTWNEEKQKYDKEPFIPGTDRHARPNDPATWRPLDVARRDRRLARPGWFLGFAFPLDGQFFGIDEDGCRDPQTGALTPRGQALLDTFPTYIEPSCSGTGLHALGETDAPFDGHKRRATEAYCRGRLFVMTGQPLPGHTEIANCSAAFAAWYAETFPEPAADVDIVNVNSSSASANLTDPTDDELLARMQRARNWPTVERLLAGDTSGYASHSEADGAMFFHLCWNSQDDEQVARMFRASGLGQRAKAQRQDYVKRSIASARAKLGGRRYEPRSRPSPPDVMPNEQVVHSVSSGADLPDDPASLKAMVLHWRGKYEAEHRAREAADVRVRELSLLQSKTMAAFRNDQLGAERATGVALAFELQNQQAADPARTEFPVCADRLAEQSGMSAHTVNTHTKRRLSQVVDRRTGEVVELFERKVRQVPGELKTQTVYIPKLPPLEILDVLANAAPLSGKPKNNHGGRADRGRCPVHPHAAVVKRVTYHCAECDRIVGEDPPIVMPNEQDAHSVDEAMNDADEPTWLADAPESDGDPGDGGRTTTHRPPPWKTTLGVTSAPHAITTLPRRPDRSARPGCTGWNRRRPIGGPI